MRKGEARLDGDSSTDHKDTRPVPKYVMINAKCSDLCWAELLDKDGNSIVSRDGYVPDFMPGEHHGDYVMITIELATGKILEWKKPTVKQLKAAFKEE